MQKAQYSTYYFLWTAFIATVLLSLGATGQTYAQTTGTCAPSVGEAYLDINEVRARIPNNGELFWRGSPDVYEVPQGAGLKAIFASGIWLGGMVDGELRVAGTTYGPYEFWAGPLNDDGSPPSDCTSFDRVWKISKSDIEAYSSQGLVSTDLRDWPTGLGALTLDAQGEPIDVTNQPLESRIDRKIDLAAGERPDISGDQMLWWIMNDLGNTHTRTKTPGIGVEIQASAYAFNADGPVGYTTFHRYHIKYKGTRPLEETYFSIFSDPDLGTAFDDYVGSDSTLGLGYVYNADNNDEGNYGAAPPAVGYDLLQGPKEPENGIDDDHDNLIDEQGERLGMTSFAFYSGGGGIQGDPGNGADMYNYMRGRWKNGQPFTIGGNGLGFSTIPTKFLFPGNPPGFWTEFNSDNLGNAIAPADRRLVVNTGPFTMRSEDEQTIVFGIITSFGSDNLDSVQKLKTDSKAVQEAFDEQFINIIPFQSQFGAEPVALLTPSDGSISHPPTILFQWKGTLQTAEYLWRIEYSEQADMQNALSVSTKEKSIVLPLKKNASYWWRVARVGRRNQIGPWSETWKLSTAESISPIVHSFQVTSNAAGPLIPPSIAAFAFNSTGFPLLNGLDRPTEGQQSTNPSLWGIHTGRGATDDFSWLTFVSRSIRNGLNDIAPYDFEVRFTPDCHEAWVAGVAANEIFDSSPDMDGCYGYDRFGDGRSLIRVPFEVWRAGIDSPHDPSDDVRMIVGTLDQDRLGWKLQDVDHPISGGSNDPQTDWSYWYLPNDMTAGPEGVGYKAWLAALIANPATATEHGPETFARIVFVSWNGGNIPGPYNATMPEPGTIFRITTSRPTIPILAAPRNGTASSPNEVQFFWSGNSGFDTLQIYSVDGLIREIPNAGSGLTVDHLPGGVMIWRVGSDQFGWSETWTVHVAASTENETADELPLEVELSANYPNPFNPQTTLQFGLPVASKVRLEVYDAIGRRVKTLVDGQTLTPGRHLVTFDGSGLPSGVYIYRLQANAITISRTMIMLK